jgi:hypothetical protein
MSATSDAVWSEEDTTPDAIEVALRQLLIERHAENEKFLPARVLNMIAFVDRQWSGEIANRLRGVERYHASRMVVLSYEPPRERLDARVMIAAEGDPDKGELALLRETVVVELGKRHLGDLLTIADPLVVTDLPTLLWSPHGHHEVVQSLLSLAQAAASRTRPTWWTSHGCARRRGVSASPRRSTRRRCGASCRCSRASPCVTIRPRPSPRCCSSAGWPRGWAGARALW